MSNDTVSAIGRYFIEKYRARLATSSVAAVALQLRKQGVPLEVARLIILRRF